MRIHSILIVRVLIVIALVGCANGPMTNTPENTARSVFKIICTNNVDDLQTLLLTSEELEAWFKEQNIPELEAQAKLMEINGMYGKLPRILNLVRTVGEKEGIIWTSTQILSVVETRESNQNKTMELTFSSSGKNYSLTCEMANSEKGWRLTGAPQASWIELE